MDLPQHIRDLIIGIGIVLGAIPCFFGYRFFKFILGLTGFVLGGGLASGIGYAISQKEAVALLAGIAGGFIGAVLMVTFYFIGIFLIGAFLGGGIGAVLFAATRSNPEPAVVLILAVIAGIIALIAQKFMIIVSTAFGGAWNVVIGIAYFTTGLIDPTNIGKLFRLGGSRLYAVLLCWGALGIVGMIVQYKSVPVTEKGVQPSARPPGEP